MSATPGSRPSSLFSVDTSITSLVLEDAKVVTEKPAPVTPVVLSWKPLMLSTAFTSVVSTRLHFTEFPPHDLHKPLFLQLSLESAQALLHDYSSPTMLSFLAQAKSKLRRVDHIPIPSSLPRELIHVLGSLEWRYFNVTNNIVPIGLGNICTSFDHHVAVRRVHKGLERYIFCPAGLCIHSTCRIEDAGVACEEEVPRETLLLREEVEIVCNKILKWWTQSLVVNQVTAAHDHFRQEWDGCVRDKWQTIKMRTAIDLLA